MADKSDLYKQIKIQVEYYFGDENYLKDKFLRAQAAQNEKGFVPISIILTFKRMQNITKSVDDVIQALKDSEMVELDESTKSLRRKQGISDEEDVNTRTLFMKWFPNDATTEEIIKAVEPLGKAVSVKLRRRADKTQKPSCWVEFESEEAAQKASQGKLNYKGKDIIILTKEGYILAKQEEADAVSKKNKKKRTRDGKKKTETNEGKQESKTEGQEEEDGPSKKKQKKERDEKPARPAKEIPKGVVVKFVGVGDEVTREILKDKFGSFGATEFVDFQRGDREGFIRFSSSESAKKAAAEFKEELGGQKPTLSVLDGDVETQYWDKVNTERNLRMNKSKRGGKGGRGGRGGRGGKQRKRF